MTPQEAITKVHRLIYMTANRYKAYTYHGKLSVEDLYQEGVLGVLKAYEKFDPSINPHFQTYAMWWIRSSIRAACLNQSRTVRVGVKHQVQQSKIGTPVPLNNVDIADVAYKLAAEQSEDDYHKAHLDAVNHALGSLEPRARTAIRMRFFEDKTLEQIGSELGVTREGARLICLRAVKKMSEHVPEHVKEYL